MSRSNYSDDLEPWALIRWRGAVASAIRGKRGQALLREMAAALDAMPRKRLIAHQLRDEQNEVCALGALGEMRGLPVGQLDPNAHDDLASAFGCARALIAEIEYINDDDHSYWNDRTTPEKRWQIMRDWVTEQLRAAA